MSTAIAGIVLAAVCAALSALALYAGSPNCRLASLQLRSSPAELRLTAPAAFPDHSPAIMPESRLIRLP